MVSVCGHQLSVRCQQPAGRSTSEGPGPAMTLRASGSPTGLPPTIRCALMLRSPPPGFKGVCDTQRILLERSFAGGAISGLPQTMAPILPLALSMNGMCGLGSENPVRAHGGSRWTGTFFEHPAPAGVDWAGVDWARVD